MRILLSEGSGLTSRQVATRLGDLGHHVELLSSTEIFPPRYNVRMERVFRYRSTGLLVIGWLMILFGLAEVMTSVSHGFLGIIHVSSAAAFTYAGGAIGLLYAASGALILTLRKWAASVALVFLGIVILARIGLVASGMYPMDTFLQLIAIGIGTSIAAAFAIYIGFRLNRFT